MFVFFRFLIFVLVFSFFFTAHFVLAQGQFLSLGINPLGPTNYYKLSWYPEIQAHPFYLGFKNDFYINQHPSYFSKISVHHLLYDHESFYVHAREVKEYQLSQGLIVNHYASKPVGYDFVSEYVSWNLGAELYPFAVNYFSNGRSFRIFSANMTAAVLDSNDNLNIQLYNIDARQNYFNKISLISGLGADLKFSVIKFFGEYATATQNIKALKYGVTLEHPEKWIALTADQSQVDSQFPLSRIDSFYENFLYRNQTVDLGVTENLVFNQISLQLKPIEMFEFEVRAGQGGWSLMGGSVLWSLNQGTFLELDYESGRFESYRKHAKFLMLFEDSSQFVLQYELFFSPVFYEQSFLNIEYQIHF